MPSTVSASPLILTSPMEGRNYYSLRLKMQMLGKDGLFIQGHTAGKNAISQTQVYQALKR